MANYRKNRTTSFQLKSARLTNPRIIIGVSVAVLVLAIALLTYGLVAAGSNGTADSELFAQGLSVGGVSIGNLTREEAEEQIRLVEEQMISNIQFTIQAGDASHAYTGNDLRFKTNVADILDESFKIGRTGDKKADKEAKKALEKEPFDYEIELELDKSSLQLLLPAIEEMCGAPPKDAEIHFDANADQKFTYTEGEGGVQPNMEKLEADILTLMESETKSGTIMLETSVVEPTVTLEEAKKRTILLARYSTTPSGTADRRTNLRLAMEAVNGTITQSGEVFSYNEILGERTAAKGYKDAATIVNGGSEMTIGGGICQGATTCYGATLRADMAVVSRTPHSWPLSYAPAGEDATVDWERIDLKMRNISEYPLYFVAYYTDSQMTVEIYGATTGYDEIKVVSKTIETYPTPEKINYIDDSTLKVGETKVEKQARGGSKAIAWREYYNDGVLVKKEDLPSTTYKTIEAVIRRHPNTVITSTPEAASEEPVESKPEEPVSKAEEPVSKAEDTVVSKAEEPVSKAEEPVESRTPDPESEVEIITPTPE